MDSGGSRLWSDVKAWAHDHEPLFGILSSIIVIAAALGWLSVRLR
jgi:hypothetical protein